MPNDYYRPVVYLSYWFDRVLGGESPGIGHLSNLMFHAAAALLVGALAARLLRDDVGGLAAGLVFATHPVHVESIAWVAGRSDVLCAIFTSARR